MLNEEIQKKYSRLQEIIKAYKKVIVAYSGGVDSAFLLKVSVDTLGKNASGVLALSPSYPSREYNDAIENAKLMGAKPKMRIF